MRLIAFFAVVGLGLLGNAVPAKAAGCAVPTAKGTAYEGNSLWRTHPTLIGKEDRDDDDRDSQGPSIVGMWHVVFTAQTMNNASFSGVIDNSVVVWHSDGTEIMNSSRPAQDGNFCLGVWVQTGKFKYYLNHLPWQGNDPSGGPNGIGMPQGGAQLTEDVTLSPDGNSYTGSFTLTAYDTNGNVEVTFTGTLSAKRITTKTKFSDLL